MATRVIKFQAFDGTLFDDEEDAREHEQREDAIVDLVCFLDNQDVCDRYFSNRDIATFLLTFYNMEKK